MLVVLASCRGDLLDVSPWGSLGSENMWLNENLADKGVNGIYAQLKNEYIGAHYSFDSYGPSADVRDADHALLQDKATTGNGMFSGYWQANYTMIHRANDAIANLHKANLSSEKYNRLMAESKFLRAFAYYKLNMVYKGVPLYLVPVELDECTQGTESEEKIWDAILNDLTDCINEINLPSKYKKGDANFGRVTKSTAYALRGKVYLWKKEWAKAEADFKEVGKAGHTLFTGGYKELFKEVNEQSDEAILSIQYLGLSGYGNEISFRYGSRVTYGSCWNTYLPSTDFVDTYETIEGKKFNWNDYIPGFNEMNVDARAVYFYRDGLTQAELDKLAKEQKADITKYLPNGNEARILTAYNNRDPRLQQTIITPYSKYIGVLNGQDQLFTLRWPYKTDVAEPFDLRTDTNNRFYYLFRKFVAEGASEIPNRSYSPIDFPIIRYADILLALAEALNEQGKTGEAVTYVNMVRARAGIALLNSNADTQVTGQANLRTRIQNEKRWELAGEGTVFFDELRWKSLQDSKIFKDSGLKQMWGTKSYSYTWAGEKTYHWPIPRKEVEMNSNLTQNPLWQD